MMRRLASDMLSMRFKARRPTKIGERLVTAEVVKREAGGWVRLKVNRCETTNDEDWHWKIPDLKAGSTIRRSIETIGKGRAVRLPWSDEAARAAVLGVRLKILGKFV